MLSSLLILFMTKKPLHLLFPSRTNSARITTTQKKCHNHHFCRDHYCCSSLSPQFCHHHHHCHCICKCVPAVTTSVNNIPYSICMLCFTVLMKTKLTISLLLCWCVHCLWVVLWHKKMHACSVLILNAEAAAPWHVWFATQSSMVHLWLTCMAWHETQQRNMVDMVGKAHMHMCLICPET